jgi:hypothetical protein
MNKPNWKIIGLMLLIVIIVSFLSTKVNAGTQTLGTFQQGECIELSQVDNATSCTIASVRSPSSSVVLTNKAMTKQGVYFNYSNFCSTNFTGQYIVSGDCDSVSWTYDFFITPNGEQSSVGSSIMYIGLLVILVLFLVVCIYWFMETDNLLVKVGSLGFGYLLLIAITFIAWNMASDFLTSSAFLVEMFRITFFVLVIGLFPLLLGMFAYYTIMVFKIKEIERLMGKGFDEKEASERVNGRKR